MYIYQVTIDSSWPLQNVSLHNFEQLLDVGDSLLCLLGDFQHLVIQKGISMQTMLFSCSKDVRRDYNQMALLW